MCANQNIKEKSFSSSFSEDSRGPCAFRLILLAAGHMQTMDWERLGKLRKNTIAFVVSGLLGKTDKLM